MSNRNNYEEETSTGWSSFMAGAFLGAGVALLLAPRSGVELRNMLCDYTRRVKEDLMDEGQEVWGAAMEEGKEQYDKGKDAVREAGRSAREFARKGVKRGQEAVKDAGRAAQEFAKQAQDAAGEAGH